MNNELTDRTHWDAAENGVVCHDACAVAAIRRLLADRDALKAALRELVDAEIGLNLGPQDNRPIDDAESRYVNAWAAVRILAAP